jgi:hypothetical protein
MLSTGASSLAKVVRRTRRKERARPLLLSSCPSGTAKGLLPGAPLRVWVHPAVCTVALAVWARLVRAQIWRTRGTLESGMRRALTALQLTHPAFLQVRSWPYALVEGARHLSWPGQALMETRPHPPQSPLTTAALREHFGEGTPDAQAWLVLLCCTGWRPMDVTRVHMEKGIIHTRHYKTNRSGKLAPLRFVPWKHLLDWLRNLPLDWSNPFDLSVDYVQTWNTHLPKDVPRLRGYGYRGSTLTYLRSCLPAGLCIVHTRHRSANTLDRAYLGLVPTQEETTISDALSKHQNPLVPC